MGPAVFPLPARTDGEAAAALKAVHAAHAARCQEAECATCGVLACRFLDTLHFHHDGCPSHAMDDERRMAVRSAGDEHLAAELRRRGYRVDPPIGKQFEAWVPRPATCCECGEREAVAEHEMVLCATCGAAGAT